MNPRAPYIAALPIVVLVAVLLVLDKPYPFLPTLIGAIAGISASFGLCAFIRKRDR